MSGKLKKTFLRIIRILMFLTGLATGFLMAGLGLATRLAESIPDGGPAAWFGTAFFEAAGISPGRIGWMLVLEGMFLIAATLAFGTRNRWGSWTTAMAAVISMIFFPGGTLAGLILALALGIRLIRERPWQRTLKQRAET
jgi:hypothetical protein